jgi:hypothetical protein
MPTYRYIITSYFEIKLKRYRRILFSPSPPSTCCGSGSVRIRNFSRADPDPNNAPNPDLTFLQQNLFNFAKFHQNAPNVFDYTNISLENLKCAAAAAVYYLTWPEHCCGSGIFIPDPNFSISDPGSKGRYRIPDPDPQQRKGIKLWVI